MIVIEVAFELVGLTAVTVPVILLVNDTFADVPMSNLWPVRVKDPVETAIDDKDSRSGLLASSKNVKLHVVDGRVQFVGMINLLSTVTT